MQALWLEGKQLSLKDDIPVPNPDKPEPKRESKEGKLLKRTEPKASYTSQRLEKRGKHKASSRIGNFPW